MSEFKSKTVAGISWSVVSQIGRQVLTFVFGIALARLLGPDPFGLVGMIVIVTQFARQLFELGFGAAIVQHQDVRDEHLSSVFWVNVGAGLLLTGGFVWGAPLLASFYGKPLLVPLTMVLAFNFAFRSLSVVQRTLLQKRIDFKALSIVEVGAVGVAGGVAIGMAYGGWGVWSLVARNVLVGAVTTVLLWTLSDWRPQFSFSFSAVRELLGFSLNLLGTRSMNYWMRNLDDLLIGRVYGEESLGIYRNAYAIMLFPLQNVSRVISRVMFPSLSSIQTDKARVKRIFLQMTRVIAVVTFPLMLGLLATTESFVLAVLGGQWSAMIPILRVLSVLGVTQSITTLVGSLYLSQGRADLQFRVGLFVKPLMIAGIVIGLQWGNLGVAVGYTIASLMASYPNMRFAGGLVDITYSGVLRNLAGVFGCAATMAVIVYGTGWLLPAAWSPTVRLFVLVPLGVVSYVTIIHAFGLHAYREARRLIVEEWENKEFFS